ncbi:MAG: DUF547 domain-containing protein, partial [Phycisphaeraceae bacterium]
AIRFWPCVITSWLAMLPGTFLYVYLGYISREGLEAAAGAQSSAGVGKWVLTAVGLVATVAVTVYVTRMATRAIKQQTRIDQAQDSPSIEPVQQTADPTPQGWPWGATVMALAAVGFLSVAAGAQFIRFGPPTTTLAEAYSENPNGPAFDHSIFDQLLESHVAAHGWVDYKALSADADNLDRYIAAVAGAPFDDLGRNEKLALLINAYNAFTLRLILDHWDGGTLASIKDIPDARRWKDKRWKVGSHVWSLNDIEHEQVRPKFKEPRIHFAMVCAAVGCPILRNEAYQADRIDQQLQDQAEYAHSHERWLRFDPDKGVVYLTKLYDWYGSDFEQVAGSVLDHAADYSPDLKQALETGRKPRIRWLDYDWQLNDKRNAP